MKFLLNPSKKTKIIFGVLTFPALAFFSFFYLEESLAWMVLTLYGGLSFLIISFVFWLIDRKQQTHLRFYSKYLLLSFLGLSILWSISSRVFYPFYRENSLKREAAFHQALEKYQAEFGHLPDSLSDPRLHDVSKRSILPFIGEYRYYLYSNRSKNKVETVPETSPSRSDSSLIVVAEPAPAPEIPPVFPQKPNVVSSISIPEGYAVSYRSFFGRVRYFGTSRHDLIRANDGFLADESEDFNEDYGETGLGKWLKSLIGKGE